MDGVEGIQKTMLLLLLGVGLFFHHGVGVEGTRVLSMEEDLELEKELKLLNKPAVKTIQLEGGDIFDCVDIYKQPAFDHPLLKDHKIQMQPSSYPLDKLKKNTTRHVKSIELPKISCPQGTVPIRRVTKEDLIRMKAHSKHEANHTRRHYASKAENYIYWHATLNIKEGVYYGGSAHINVWGLDIEPGEWSSAQIFVRSGFSGTDHTLMNAVEAGWRIEPNLFGDSQTRFFIYWTGDGYVNTGCYNHLCPGFVQTSNIVGLGAPVSPLSTFAGDQYELRITIYKEPATRQWWLLMYGDQFIGYWPDTLFNSLRDSASEVYWGGNAGSPPPTSSTYKLSPPMGSGYHSIEGYSQAAFMDNVLLVDNNNAFYDPAYKDTRDSVGPGLRFIISSCYGMFDEGYRNAVDRYRFYYGGPGLCLPPI